MSQATIIAIVGGYALLIVAFVWIIIIYRKKSEDAADFKIKYQQAQRRVENLTETLLEQDEKTQANVSELKTMYEKRLASQREAIEKLEKQLLSKGRGNNNFDALILSELSKDDQD
jgi:hypothetical protein